MKKKLLAALNIFLFTTFIIAVAWFADICDNNEYAVGNPKLMLETFIKKGYVFVWAGAPVIFFLFYLTFAHYMKRYSNAEEGRETQLVTAQQVSVRIRDYREYGDPGKLRTVAVKLRERVLDPANGWQYLPAGQRSILISSILDAGEQYPVLFGARHMVRQDLGVEVRHRTNAGVESLDIRFWFQGKDPENEIRALLEGLGLEEQKPSLLRRADTPLCKTPVQEGNSS
jgi:hypothetical protein